MIIWRGKGTLVILSLVIGIGITNVFLGNFIGNLSDRTYSVLETLVSTVLISGSNYLLTKKFVSDKVQFLVDEETGERVHLKDSSSLFFIPNKYWTWIILVIGLIATVGLYFE